MVEYKVGDDVSYGINGDSYYAGKIARMTKCRMFTDQGYQFSLVNTSQGPAWRMTGNKYCWLRKGVHEYLDPHF